VGGTSIAPFQSLSWSSGMFSIINTGLTSSQRDLSVTANNLANANTTGFKKSKSMMVDIFANDPSANPKTSVGSGTMLSVVSKDMSQGAMISTGRVTELAIAGMGFFVVGTQDTTSADPVKSLSYTRNGAFSLNREGFLVNNQGSFVYGNDLRTSQELTPIQIPFDNGSDAAVLQGIDVNSEGVVSATYSDGTVNRMFSIALANFPNAEGLKPIGNTNYIATGDSGSVSYGTGKKNGLGTILTGTLEQSNTDITAELLNMLKTQQNYNGNARMLQTYVEIASRLTDKI
jgi:flagellar hook protein FlgE